MNQPRPLVIDLDGTLIRTDTLWESLLILIKKRPLATMQLPLWLLRGKASFKRKVFDRVQIDVETLPYNQAVVKLAAGAQGLRPVILASASDLRVVQRISTHLGLFNGVIGTENKNQAGQNKLEAIRERIGIASFDYVGNSPTDIPIWNEAHTAYVIGSSALARSIRPGVEVEHLPDQRPLLIRAFFKAMRPHQWVKNLLLFAPLFLAHKITDPYRLVQLMWAFAAMSLCASGVYIVNDLLDLETDRRHPHKRNRPFASGTLSVASGVVGATLLFFGATLISLVGVSKTFLWMLFSYILVTFAYSVDLKRRLFADVITLAGLYTLRLFSGSIAADVPISPWMLTFSSFFFLSLALVKRYIELLHYTEYERGMVPGRSYEVEDQSVVLAAGVGSGYISILVLLLYVGSSPQSHELYRTPELLWILSPLLTYWLTRIWFLARRGRVDDDPVLFALKDRVSWLVGVLMATVVLLATFL